MDYKSNQEQIEGFNNKWFIFGGPKPLSQTSIARYKDNAVKESGVKRIRIHDFRHPYVKHTTKKYNSEKQKTQATKMNLIAWVFRFCTFNYSKRSWTL